mmetsp:Transcript_91128/g.229097  ORF Transcript_91128/g.229097 Transcript_91128/m.229097 type:complete len:233 (+) Transcript_91128:209-907(+)
MLPAGIPPLLLDSAPFRTPLKNWMDRRTSKGIVCSIHSMMQRRRSISSKRLTKLGWDPSTAFWPFLDAPRVDERPPLLEETDFASSSQAVAASGLCAATAAAASATACCCWPRYCSCSARNSSRHFSKASICDVTSARRAMTSTRSPPRLRASSPTRSSSQSSGLSKLTFSLSSWISFVATASLTTTSSTLSSSVATRCSSFFLASRPLGMPASASSASSCADWRFCSSNSR